MDKNSTGITERHIVKLVEAIIAALPSGTISVCRISSLYPFHYFARVRACKSDLNCWFNCWIS